FCTTVATSAGTRERRCRSDSPASSSSTVKSPGSASRAAIAHPAEPPPTTTMSNMIPPRSQAGRAQRPPWASYLYQLLVYSSSAGGRGGERGCWKLRVIGDLSRVNARRYPQKIALLHGERS